MQQADCCRTGARGGSWACIWSSPRSAARSSAPPPGGQRAQASPLSPHSTAASAAAAAAAAASLFAPHPRPSVPEPPQPDPSSSGPDSTAVGISLLTHARTHTAAGGSSWRALLIHAGMVAASHIGAAGCELFQVCRSFVLLEIPLVENKGQEGGNRGERNKKAKI